MIDYEAARFWLVVVQWIVTGLVALYAWHVGRSRAGARAMDELSKRIDDNQRRIDLLERDLRDAPGKDQFHDMYESLSGLRAEVRQMTGTMHGLGRAVDLMTQHLLDRGGSK